MVNIAASFSPRQHVGLGQPRQVVSGLWPPGAVLRLRRHQHLFRRFRPPHHSRPSSHAQAYHRAYHDGSAYHNNPSAYNSHPYTRGYHYNHNYAYAYHHCDFQAYDNYAYAYHNNYYAYAYNHLPQTPVLRCAPVGRRRLLRQVVCPQLSHLQLLSGRLLQV